MADYLDDRQRAMLAEMGLGIWQLTAVLHPSPEVTAPANSQRAAVSSAIPVDREQGKSPVARAANFAGETTQIPSAASSALPTRPQSERVRAGNWADLKLLSWHQLEHTARNCRDCGLCASREASVWGQWFGIPAKVGEQDSVLQATILVLTDPPDEADEITGLPLGGEQSAAGSLLQAMLHAAGWGSSRSADAVFVTPVTKCKVPAGYKLGKDELMACRRYVEQQISLLQPKMILTMGRLAAQTMLGPEANQGSSPPLGQLRGTVHHVQGHALVASLAPHYLLRNPLEKAKAWEDLCLARAHLSPHSS